MLHAMLTPLSAGVHCNPGSLLIEHSVRWLLRRADPQAQFLMVSLRSPDRDGWRTLKRQADTVIWCGNPRLNDSDVGQYCDFGVWRPLLKAIDAGVMFIDAWAGSSYPYAPLDTFEQRYARLAANVKNVAILQWEKRAALVIARDRLAEHLLARHANTVRFPCSTWFARKYWRIEPGPKTQNAIIVRRLPGHPEVVRTALAAREALTAAQKPVILAAHNVADVDWYRRHGCKEPILVLCDPETLLRFLAITDKLLSWRVHASVPALSLGTQVANVEIDGRAAVLDEFGVPSLPMDFKPADMVFHRAQFIPNEDKIVSTLQEYLKPRQWNKK